MPRHEHAIDSMGALIARLEAASEGSRELDRQIWLALPAHRIIPVKEVGGHTYDRWEDGETLRRPINQTHFTTSLDAALTLVPAGWGWRLDTTSTMPELKALGITTKTIASCVWLTKGVAQPLEKHVATGAGSAPLALCIASLKARSASNGD